MARQQNHLTLRGNTWHVRLDIPADARPYFGNRKVLSESLKTGDKRLAKERGALLIAQWKTEIRTARDQRATQTEVWRSDIVRGAGNFEGIMDALLLKVVRREIPDPVEQLILGGLDSVADEWQADDRYRIFHHLKQLLHAGMDDGLHQFLRQYSDDDDPDPIARFDALRLFLKSNLHELWSQGYNLDKSERLEAQALVRTPESYRPKSPYSARLLKKFFTYASTQVKESTLLQYRLRIETFSAWVEQTGSAITFKNVALFLDSMSQNSVTRKGYLAALRKLHKWLLKNDDYYPRLFPDGEKPFEDHEHARRGHDGSEEWAIFTKEEVETLHAAAQERNDQELADLIALGAFTGCRISELGWLQAEHVVVDSGDPTAIYITKAKSKAGIRTIPISSKLRPTIKRLLSRPHGPHKFLFSGPNRLTGRMRIPALSERFTNLKTSLGHPELAVFHSIRKCFTTELENRHADPLVIIRLLGHGTRQLTFDTYSGGVFFGRAKQAIEKLQFNFEQPH